MRKQADLEDWLALQLETRNFQRHPLKGDASFRSYERIAAHQKTYILMDSHGDESLNQFLAIAKLLSAHQIHAPKIFAVEAQRAWVLLEDLGTLHYEDCLSPSCADDLYSDAFKVITQLQKIVPTEGMIFKNYDEAFFDVQWQLFRTWYSQTHLSQTGSLCDTSEIRSSLGALKKCVLTQPKALAHMDFHCRNLMSTPIHNPGVIDFQDMMYAPITYDLASLLKDCYLKFPRAQVNNWLSRYYQTHLLSAHQNYYGNEQAFIRAFDWVAVQRHLKVLGIFARLHHRDKKSLYLQAMPLVKAYLLESFAIYPELQALALLIDGGH